ncbi:MAG: fibronectin type III domain-containing protein [Bacteroidota bacterium]
MNKLKTICAMLCIGIIASMLLPAQVPLSNNIAAVGVLGQTDLLSNTLGLSASKMDMPKGIAIDPTTGKLFVADYNNRRVLRWSSAEKMINGAAAEAVLGQPDFVTNTTGTSSTTMARPYGITVDAAGRLWVADLSNNRVLRFDNASTLTSGAAATRVLGQADFATGTANTGGISASTMSAPIGVFVDAAGRLWVAERDNKRVLRFDNAAAKSNGDPADGVLGEPDFATNTGGLTPALITRAYGIVGDASGNIWVADRDNNRVLRFDNAAAKTNGDSADGVLGQADFMSNVVARTQSSLEGPRGVFLDAAGRLYVSDEANNRILAYNEAMYKANGDIADHVIGQLDFVSKIATIEPTPTTVNYPEFLVVDNTKNQLWVADEYNHRILRFDLTPRLGVGVLGQADFATNGTGLSSSKVDMPKGIAIDPTTGKLFVADYNNRRVLRWGSADKMLDGAAAEAVLGQPDFVTNTSGTSSTKMARPYGITVDGGGRLWVSDLSNNRVLRFDNASFLASGAAATRVLGQADFATGTANTGGISASTMSAPIGLFVDGTGRLWVAERDNKRVLRFDNAVAKSNGDAADAVLGEPDFTTNAGGLSASLITRGYGITGDANGTIWVSDRDNNRVLRFDNAAGKANGAAADGVIGQADFVTSTSGRDQNSINGPRGVFINPAGKLYVTDEGNNRIMVFDSAATKGDGPNATYVFGQTDYFSAFNPTPPTAGSVNYPEFLVVDNVYKLIWLADEYNHRIVRYHEGETPVVIVAPAPPQNLAARRGNAQVTLKWNQNSENDFAQYRIYGGTSVNPTTLLASTTGGKADTMKVIASLTNETKYYFRITAVNLNGMESGYSNEAEVTPSILTVAVGVLGTSDFVTNTGWTSPTDSTLSEPASVAIDPTTGKLFVADRDNRRVLRFGSAEKYINGAKAEAVFGQPDFVSRVANNPTISASTMSNPNGVAVDATGRLWVADRDNHRVLRFDNASFKATSGAADGVLGQPDFVTNVMGTSGGKMSSPSGVCADASGRLWVADRANNRVLRYDNAAAKANGALPNGVLGQDSYSSSTTGTTAATMNAPWGVFFDVNGRLWVADRYNSRVLRFDNAAVKANGADANGVLGQADFLTSATATTQSGFYEPRGVVVDAAGRLYVADEGNSRVMVYENAATKSNGANADNVYGQDDFMSNAALDPPTASSLNYPLSVFVDNANSHVWIPDIYNHRVLRYNGPAINITTPAAPKNLAAQSGNAQVTLKWNKNTEGDFVRYRIYGGTSANPTTKLDSTTGGLLDTTKIVTGLTNETKYYFRVTAVNTYGMESPYSNEVNATPSTTGVDNDGGTLPTVYSLSQNFPNPFNPSTTIRFGLPEVSDVSLKIYDMLGREVITIVNTRLSAGYYNFEWNASRYSSGVYVYRLNATSVNGTVQQNFREVKKLMLQK